MIMVYICRFYFIAGWAKHSLELTLYRQQQQSLETPAILDMKWYGEAYAHHQNYMMLMPC